MRYKTNLLQRHFWVKLLFVVAAVLLCSYVVHAENTPALTARTLYVFPSRITSADWNNVAGLYTQDYGNNALYQDFNRTGSAYLTTDKESEVKKVDTPNVPRAETSSPTISTAPTSVNASTSGDIPAQSVNTSVPTNATGGNPSAPPDPSVSAPSPNELPQPEAVPPPDTGKQSSGSSAPSASLLKTSLAKITEKFSLLFGETIEPSPSSSTTQGVSSSGDIATPSTSVPTTDGNKVQSVSVGEKGQAAVGSAVFTGPHATLQIGTTSLNMSQGASSTASTSAPAAEKHFCEGEEGCRTQTVHFDGFDLPGLGSGEMIQDAQLRLSVAAKPRANRSRTNEGMLIEYSLDGTWHDAGVIAMTDEVSNAINGGYFLYALPEIANVDLLKAMQVRVTYYGDLADFENIFIDSAWVQLGVLTLDEASLRARVSPTALTDLEKPTEHELLSSQVDFTEGQLPSFALKYHEQRNFIVRFFRSIFAKKVATVAHVSLVHNESGDSGIVPDVNMTDDGLWTISVPASERERLKPGKYKLEITVDEGSVPYQDSLEFQWGLLALNTHKSEYEKGEIAQISLAALSENGNTICDAHLLLYVLQPDDFIKRLPVTSSGKCFGNNVVDTPDYTASYDTTVSGKHTLYVERVDDAGNVISHTEDTFEVVDSAPISIERKAPTRIYPVSPYDMAITVTAHQDFSGTFIEQVPYDYEVSNTDATTTIEGERKKLIWNISLKKGESHTFTYSFDSPDVSPFLYLLGPASVVLKEGETFNPTVISSSTLPIASASSTTETVTPATPQSPIMENIVVSSSTESVVVHEEPKSITSSSRSEQTTSSSSVSTPVVTPTSTSQETAATSTIVIPAVLPEPDMLPTVPSQSQPLLASTYVEDLSATGTAKVAAPSVTTAESTKALAEEASATSTKRDSSFTEKRSWQIASDATGSMIVLWTDGASIPAGWTCISCVATNTMYQRFPKGGATYNTTGGVSTSTHTASGTVQATSDAGTENNVGVNVSLSSHSHTFTPVVVATSTLPGYRQLRFIQNNSAGTPASLPAGVVLMFDSSVPAGWARYAPLDNRFPQGENTILTAGTSTHSHDIVGTTTVASGSTVNNRTGGTQNPGADASHQHTLTATTTRTSDEPPFITVIYGTTTVATTTPLNAITMWTDTPPAGWLNRSAQAGDPFFDVFPKGGTSYGTTGGSKTHTHGSITASSSASTISTTARTGVTGSPATHTHLITVDTFTTDSHEPPYATVIFAKYLGLNPSYTQNSFRWYANLATSTTPIDPWPAGVSDLSENEAIDSTNTPVRSGDVVRLRMQLGIQVSTSTSQAFKMQFGSSTVGSTCASIPIWTDVGVSTSSVEWRGYDNASLADGATLSSSTLSGTNVVESYQENNPSTSTPNQIGIGQNGEWDFALQQNNAYPNALYCFRMVKSDGTQLFAYTTYPSATTNNSPDAPTLNSPFNNEAASSTLPLFTFSGTDPELDTITYQIQIDDDSAFGSVNVDKNSATNGSQFDDLTTSSGKDPFVAGDEMQFHLTAPLTNNTTYYWRVRGKDPAGSNAYGVWSTVQSFTASTSVITSTWFQTMQPQFNTDTLFGTQATATNAVQLISGSTTGTTTSSAINFSDGATGNAWGSLSFTHTVTSSSISYHIQYYDQTNQVWSLVPDGALAGNAAGFTTSPVSLLTVDITQYPTIRVSADFTNSGASPILFDWTVSWGYRVQTPTLISLFDNENTGTTTPLFEFYTTDPQNDALQYEFSWSTTSAFTSSTTRLSGVNTGFVDSTHVGSTSPFASGDHVQFTIQPVDALANNQTYFWRVRARDPGGTNAWSFYSTPRSITASTSVVVSTWFQTTSEQFSTDDFTSIATLGTTSVTVATSTGNALVAYAEGVATTPKYRLWNGSAWSSQGNALDVGAAIAWVVTKASPNSNQYAVGTMGTDAHINVQIYSQGSWANKQLITNSIPNTNMRGFDLAYETVSGHLMAVACDGDANPTYYIWNGTSWVNGGAVGLTAGNTCGWIKLISNPTSNEIIAVTRDTTGITYEARVWNGTSWGNSVTWGSMVAANINNEGMAAEYEESGNQAVVAVSNGATNGFTWRAWGAGAWTAASAVGAARFNDFEWGTMARDVGTDNLGLCTEDLSNRLGLSTWNGSAWTSVNTGFETSAGVHTDRRIDCQYETVGSRDGKLMMPFNDTTTMRYSFYDGATISGKGTIATTTTTSSSTVQMRRTGDGKLLEINFNNTFDRYDFSWWGGATVASSTWSTPAQIIDSNASNGASPFREPFMMAPQNQLTSGILTGSTIDFNNGSGPYWKQFSWVDTQTGGSSILYQVQYFDSSLGVWSLVPNTLIPGNSTGTTTSPINLSNVLPVTTYNKLRPVANMQCNLGTCPSIQDWTVTWAAGITISGTAKQYDQSTNVTSGTVAVAVNGVLQAGRTGTISGGTWSIANVKANAGDTITVFVQGAASTNKAVGVTNYDGVGDITGINLFERHLSLGSDDLATTTNAQIKLYDFTNSSDVFADVDAGNTLTVCATTGCEDAELYVKAGNVYQPGSSANVTTINFENSGTFLPNGNTVRVAGSWDNHATATMATSSLIFTATSTSVTVNDTGAVPVTYNNVTFGETSGNAIWTLVTDLTVGGNLSTTYGTLARNSRAVVVAGNITNGASGLWTGTGSTTFNGANAATWTDSAVSKQNFGKVLVDGTSKYVTLGSDVKSENVVIGADDTLDASVSGYTLQVYKHLNNNNVFVARTGTVEFSATSTNNTINPGSSSFYNVLFDGPGSWAFSVANITVGNDITISTGTLTLPTGTTTVAGSWNSTGGLFAHNNGGVTFTAGSAKTITLAGSNFTNTFYNLAFSGAGSWSFATANATTSNDLSMTQGTVTLPSGILALGGNLNGSGGSFSGNSGIVQLTAATAKTLQLNGSSFASLRVTGSGSWSFVDSNVTATGDVVISNGTLTLPSGTLTLGGSFTNTATFAHNSGTVLFNSSASGKTINPGSSPFSSVTLNNSSGGWTIAADATTTNAFTLTNASSFTLASGKYLSVGGTFTNSVGGAATTWTGSRLALVSNTAYPINTKANSGDLYDTMILTGTTNPNMWYSSSTLYTLSASSSLYSQDHFNVHGSLYIFGAYQRNSGTENWSYATDFDGTALTGSSTRQANVRFAPGASATFSTSTLSIMGTTTASTTIASQSGTYTIAISAGTTTASYYAFSNLGFTGVTLGTSTKVTALSDGSFTPGVANGTGLTVSSSTIDANPALQIFRVTFSTTTAIAATNVTQTIGVPSSYWWFRTTSGNLAGEAHDNDTGDPGSIRWDDSNLLITISGTVYADEGVTPLGNPTCNGATAVVTIVINGGTTYTGTCSNVNGTYSIPNVAVLGSPVATVYLNTNGGVQATTITKTPTQNISNLNLYANRIITRHEDVADPLTIADMAKFDETNDTDIRYDAATGTTNTLTVRPNTELHIASSTTFIPGGPITLQSGGTGTTYDGTLHLDASSTFMGVGTTTYSIGGRLAVDTNAVFNAASSTVVLTATTTSKNITTPSPQTITFNNLQFAGVGGGWSIDGDILVNGSMDVATGSVSGAANITVANNSISGTGTVAMTGGTTLIKKTNTLGGIFPWTFYNLTLGDGSTVGATTRSANATTTVSGVLTVAAGHTLTMGTSQWNLAGGGTPLVVTGTLSAGTGTVRYSATSSANIVSTTYYNLDLNASLSSPTYTATGIGVNVLGSLSVGSLGTTTVNVDTNDPALGVTGSVAIASRGTLIGSNSGSFTVAGSWSNLGTFTSSNGTVSFTGGGAVSIAPGTSSFGSAIINGAGTFTLTQNATATSAFTITAAAGFIVNSGITLAVGGTLANNLGGAPTTWTGSILSLYGGGNYEINASTTNDSYATLRVGASTNIRMWNSSASTTMVDPTGSLYSQNNANVNGALYIYGDYKKTSGTDYWSYATNFDGTALGGSSRAVTVSFAQNATATIAGGTLNIIGGAVASTTITNQGSGSYAFIVNAGTLNARYYLVRNANANGLVLTNTPTITNLSNGDFQVAQNNGSAITVGGTVIDQNPAKTFSGNIFATSSGVSPAVNVTATGTSVSSWRFTGHTGAIAGEAFDSDPGGDPGYIVWDNSAGTITISGNVYSDEGSTPIGAPTCNGASTTVRLVVQGLTSYSTSCNAGTGAYSISGIAYSPGDELALYLDTNGGAQAANITVSPLSSIGNMHLYQNRVIVRHEDTSPITIANMSLWDSTKDSDVPFTATIGSPNTLTLPANKKLIIWNNKTFAPGGNMTLSGGGAGAAYDGTLELYTGAVFTAAGTQSHSIGGSLITGNTATITPAQATFTFTTTGANRTIDTNDGSLYNAIFNGSGSWTSSDVNFSVGNDLTITTGTVTLPTGTTTVAGSFQNTGGVFNHATGTLYFTSTSAGKTVRLNTSPMYRATFNGSGGAWSIFGSQATTTSNLIISAGTVTFPTGTFAVGGSFNAAGGAFVHNSGTVKLMATSTATRLTANGSTFSSLTIESTSGGYSMSDTNVDMLGTLRITQGALTLATGTVSIGGSLLNIGGTFAHASGTILFNASSAGKTITPGNSLFNNVSLASPTGGWTISGNATTTGNFSLTSASQFTMASDTKLYVSGVFTNTVGGASTTWDGAIVDIETGSNYTINTSSTGGDQYQTLVIGPSTALRMWNSAATTTTIATSSSLYSQNNAGVNGALSIYGNYTRTSGSDYWSYATNFDGTALGGSSRAVTVSFAANATATYTGASLAIVGGSAGATTTITNQGSGTYTLIVDGGTINASYYAVRNADVSGLQLSDLTTVSSLSQGDFQLAVSGGSLITLASSTLNANASLTISGMRFATTTTITGFNVNLNGTTTSAWTFTGYTGNLAGEAFDNDGATACGSIRWSDSVCLITSQTHYRWRNNNGGESVPDSEWYNASWSKRKRVTLTNSDATTYTNAVVKVPVTYNSNMRADFGDLRFTDSSGTTTIPYWIETYAASNNATVWVRVPTMTASAVTSVYMYYGNGVATDGSTGSTTFSTFDDFEDGNISEYSGDTSLFTVGSTNVYERTKRLDAANPNGRTITGIYNTSVSVGQGKTIRYFQYIDTSGGSGDESCTLFGVQTPGSNKNNYGVCLELFGTDRVSIVKNAYDNDSDATMLSSSTITYATGWHEVEIRWKTDNTINVTVSRNGSIVATTSATDSSYTTGGIGYTFWFQHGGWDMYTSRPLLTTEPTVGYGVEQVAGGATWYSAIDTLASGITPSTTQRLRMVVENAGIAINNQNYRLEYATKGASPSCEAVSLGSYAQVPVQASCGSSPFCMQSSTYYSNQASTTDLLTGNGTYTYGQIMKDPSNLTGNLTLQANEYTEVEYALAATSYANAASYCFRVSNNGTNLDSYTKVAEVGMQYNPRVLSWSVNNGQDITLTPGTTTAIFATGTVSDANGYADLYYATSTLYRSGVGSSCVASSSNCYQVASSSCALSGCSGNSCNVSCVANVYFFADATDIGTYSAQDWRADLLISDRENGHDTQSTIGVETMTLRALDVSSPIGYTAVAVTQDTGPVDATTTVSNIGNDHIDVSISGTDLADASASIIPVTTQKYATSTFTYSSCVFCSVLSTSSASYDVNLSKATTSVSLPSTNVYWGISIPYGATAMPHSGVTTFMAIAG